MPSKARKSPKKVRLEKATASEILASYRITRREALLAEAAVAAVMGRNSDQNSAKPSTDSSSEVVV
jgi:hypothetical protein